MVFDITLFSGCPIDFLQAEALYCDKDCGTIWLDDEYGCQQEDADAFCRLKNCDVQSHSLSFNVSLSTNTPGFSCRGIGKNFGKVIGISDVHFVTDIKSTHGTGDVVTNITCKTTSSILVA